MDALTAARDALADGEREVALLALLDAWREVRSVRIARLIDKLGLRVTRRALGTKPIKKANQRWHEVAAARDPLDLPRLFAAMTTGGVAAAKKRVDVLATFPDDPRMATGLATLLAVAPYFGSATSEALAAAARAMILRGADERVVATLAPYTERADIAKLAAEVRAAITPDALPATARARCDELDRLLGSSPDELLAAIYDTPRDDAPREVYADWLLEHGEEAYGEWIQLQLRAARGVLTPEAATRMAELWTGLERRLSAPFAKVTEASSRVFERGFLVRCRVRVANSRALPTAAADPAWQTVEQLEVDDMYVANALALPAFRNVRQLGTISYDLLLRIAGGPPRPIEVVRLSSIPAERAAEPITWNLDRLTGLVLPPFQGPTGLAWLWQTRLGAQVRWLGVDLALLADWLAAVPPHVEAVGAPGVACCRVADRWSVEVDVDRLPPTTRPPLEEVRAAIARIPQASIAVQLDLRR